MNAKATNLIGAVGGVFPERPGSGRSRRIRLSASPPPPPPSVESQAPAKSPGAPANPTAPAGITPARVSYLNGEVSLRVRGPATDAGQGEYAARAG